MLPKLDAIYQYAVFYAPAQWLFLRGLGVIYALVFLSLSFQVRGLYGSRGLLPIQFYLDAIYHFKRRAAFELAPSIFWFFREDWFIEAVAIVGAGLSFLVVFDVCTPVALLVIWFLYLSYVSVGQDFMSFQWDILLLEVGLMAFFVSLNPASPWMLFAMWVMLARFMLSSGIVKLIRHDKTWKNLTALTYHYQTQPLPNPVAWYLHQMPVWMHKLSCFVMFMIELIVPFGIFGPPKVQLVACLLLVLLQLVIIISGNYAFFNWLTIVMCLSLVHVTYVGKFIPVTFLPASISSLDGLLFAAALFYVVVNVFHLVHFFIKPEWMSNTLLDLQTAFVSWSYGLFSVMTTTRHELILEGSNDGQTWFEYQFRFKPSNPRRHLPIVAPHQPRIDWQMWFAALRKNSIEPWLRNLIQRLLEGSHDVETLLERSPFHHPPQMIRISVYDYVFTTPQERKATGLWWRRTLLHQGAPIKRQ